MKKIFGLLLIFSVMIISCSKKSDDPAVGSDKQSKKSDLAIKIPLVTWGGYAALFAANNGAEPKEDSLFYKYGGFKVELVQEEDPANQLQGFASGTYSIIWSTMDMLPLIYDSLSKDSRTVPQVIGLFDYSAGGDGIIVRGNINNGNDMKGKKIVVAQFTPSHFFIMWYLSTFNMTEKDVKMIFVPDAIKAKEAFVAESSIDVCVTWSPFIYDITDSKKDTYVKGSKLLTTTQKGNDSYGLIADVYIARTDLLKNHPEVIEAFTKAMIEGYDLFSADKPKYAKQIASFFGIKGGADEVMLMFEDVTIASKNENKMFFDKSGKTSAYKIFDLSVDLYKKNGSAIPESFKVDASSVIYSDAMTKSISQ